MENNRKEKKNPKSNKAETFLIPVLQVGEIKNQGDAHEQKIAQEVITQWVYNKLGTETRPVWERWAHWAKNWVLQLKQKKKQKNETKRSKMHMISIWFNCSLTDTYIQCIRPKNSMHSGALVSVRQRNCWRLPLSKWLKSFRQIIILRELNKDPKQRHNYVGLKMLKLSKYFHFQLHMAVLTMLMQQVHFSSQFQLPGV